MVVGLYGLAYAYAAWRLERAVPLLAIGLLGKLLGPVGWLMAVSSGELPARTFTMIVFNDLVWWLPFALFLLEDTRIAAPVRASAPYVCAALNLAAAIAMAAVLRFGTEAVPNVAERIAYITEHAALWRAGWSVWIAAALSLTAFYAWWGSHLRDQRWAMVALGTVSAGLVCDLFAESLLIGWLPRDHELIAPFASILMGAVANGLYTAAGVVLTLATKSLRGWLRVMAWGVWTAGGFLTVSTLAGSVNGTVISTVALFALFCPWVVLFGRALRQAGLEIHSSAQPAVASTRS